MAERTHLCIGCKYGGTTHKSGYCKSCRTRSCLECGERYISQSGHTRCSSCTKNARKVSSFFADGSI